MELWIAAEEGGGPTYQLYPASQVPAGWLTAERTYSLRLTGFASASPLAGCRLVVGDVDQGAGRYERADVLSWRWEARDYVGQVTVGLEPAAGAPLWPVQEILVDPPRHKLTRAQFARMVEDIHAEALVAYSLSPATRPIALTQSQQHLGLAQLEYLRHQLPALRHAVEAIARRPRRTLYREAFVAPLAYGPVVDDRAIADLWQHPDVLQ